MIENQGFRIAKEGLEIPNGVALKMAVPIELVPHCPKCGDPMSMNLRYDNTFVENEGWRKATQRYEDFLRRHEGLHILFLDLGVFKSHHCTKFTFIILASHDSSLNLHLLFPNNH